MTKYQNISNITFNGNNNHIGDKYESYGAYVSINDLSPEEKEFLKPIFDHFEGSEKQILLDALDKIRNGKVANVEPQETSLIGKYINKLKETGITKAVDALYSFLCKKAEILIPVLDDMGIDVSNTQ